VLQPYAAHFGSDGDVGIKALDQDTTVGAAWVRPMTGFATQHIEDDEHAYVKDLLSIACLPAYQGRGIGTKLLQELLSILKESSRYKGVCLSCIETNVRAMKVNQRI